MTAFRKLWITCVILIVSTCSSWWNGGSSVTAQRVAGNCKPGLLKFGEAAGDDPLPAFDTSGTPPFASKEIPLPTPIHVLGEGPYNQVYINLQGLFSMEAPSYVVPTSMGFDENAPAVVINAKTFDTTGIAGGTVFYRLVKNNPDGEQDMLDVTQKAAEIWGPGLTFDWALIVTWSCVHISGQPDEARETFQSIMATTPGSTTFLINQYTEFVDVTAKVLLGVQARNKPFWPPTVAPGNELTAQLLLGFSYGCPCGRWSFRIDYAGGVQSPDNFPTPCDACTDVSPDNCVECNEDYALQCQCELYASRDAPDPQLIHVASFLQDGKPDMSFPVPAGVSGDWEFKLVATSVKLDTCKFNIFATMRRTVEGDVYIAVLEIRYGFLSSTSFTTLLKIKDGQNLFVHPNRHTPTLPYTMEYVDNITVTIEERDDNIYRIHSPECGWRIMYVANNLGIDGRALVIYTDKRPMEPGLPCGECNENLVTTPAPPFDPTFQHDCLCKSLAPLVTNFDSLNVSFPQFSTTNKVIDLVRTTDKTDVCKFRISVTLAKEGGEIFIELVDIRFGMKVDTTSGFAKQLRIKDGEKFFLYPTRTLQIPEFMLEDGSITVFAAYEDPDAIRVHSPECGWNFYLRGRAVPAFERHAFVDVSAMGFTGASFCGDKCTAITLSPPDSTPPPTDTFTGDCQCRMVTLPTTPSPKHLSLTAYDNTTTDYTETNKGDITKSANKFDPCKFRATVILGTDGEGNTVINVAEMRFGKHPSQDSSYDKLLKFKDGTKAILRPDGITLDLTTPFTYVNSETLKAVIIETISHDGFRVHSPDCGWEMIYYAKTREKYLREYVVDTVIRDLDGRCGNCVDPNLGTGVNL